METGTITEAGERRSGLPAGTLVGFTRHPQFPNIALDIFVGDERMAGYLQIAGEDGGINMEERDGTVQ